MLSSQSIITYLLVLYLLLMRNGASQRNLNIVEVMIDTHIIKIYFIHFILLQFFLFLFMMAILRPTNVCIILVSSIPQSLLEFISIAVSMSSALPVKVKKKFIFSYFLAFFSVLRIQLINLYSMLTHHRESETKHKQALADSLLSHRFRYKH